MSSYTRQQLEEHLKTVDVKADRVLDVGGTQLTIKGRTKSWKVRDYKILDLEEPHECKEKPDLWADLNIPFWHTDKIKSPNIDIYKNCKEHDFDSYLRYFDVAFCLEVSEYWFNPFQALTNINDLLEKDGILYISFHFIYPAHNPVEQDYLRYTPRGAEKLLEETGFEIIEMIPRLESENSLIKAAYSVEEMHSAKNYDKHDWVGCIIKCRKI